MSDNLNDLLREIGQAFQQARDENEDQRIAREEAEALGRRAAMIEGADFLVQALDEIKVKLEQRGWNTSSAEQASIMLMGTTIAMGDRG